MNIEVFNPDLRLVWFPIWLWETDYTPTQPINPKERIFVEDFFISYMYRVDEYIINDDFYSSVLTSSILLIPLLSDMCGLGNQTPIIKPNSPE